LVWLTAPAEISSCVTPAICAMLAAVASSITALCETPQHFCKTHDAATSRVTLVQEVPIRDGCVAWK
jgi:hypothetical protein